MMMVNGIDLIPLLACFGLSEEVVEAVSISVRIELYQHPRSPLGIHLFPTVLCS